MRGRLFTQRVNLKKLSDPSNPDFLRWLIFALAASLFLLSQFYRVSNAVIAPDLIADLSLDTKSIGLMSAVFFYAFALTQIPISLLLDKVGPRSMMTVLSGIGALGAVIYSMADTLTAGVTGRILLGVGMACNLMGSYKLLTIWFSPLAFASVAGILVAVGAVGNMFATTPLVLMVDHLGWRLSFQLIAGVNLILAAAFYIIVRDRPRQHRPGPETSAAVMHIKQAAGNLKLLFRSKDYWIISFATFARYGIFAAFQALWAGPYLLEVIGLSALATGNLILLLNAGMILGSPCWGALSDRLFQTRKWIVVAGSLGMAASILALAAVSPQTPYAVLAVIFFCFGFFNATGLLMYPHIKELMPPDMSGAAMTGINFFTMIGPAVFLQGLGSLMQSLYPEASRGPDAFNAVFAVCLIFILTVAVLYSLAAEKRAGA